MEKNRTKKIIFILTVLNVVLLGGRGKGQDLPIDIWQRWRVFQSNPENFLQRIPCWEKTHPLGIEVTFKCVWIKQMIYAILYARTNIHYVKSIKAFWMKTPSVPNEGGGLGMSSWPPSDLSQCSASNSFQHQTLQTNHIIRHGLKWTCSSFTRAMVWWAYKLTDWTDDISK